MGRVLTNNISLAYALETSVATLPASPSWKLLEPNSISNWGATITTVARQPISKTRQRRKGTTTDLDSAVEFEADLTLDSFEDFAEGFVFAQSNSPVDRVAEVTAADDVYRIANPTLLWLAGMLVFARGFTTADNNGLKEIGTFTAAVAASRVLTLTPSAPPDIADGDQVIINGVYYQFESAAIDDGDGSSGDPYRVDIGVDDETSLDNLIAAINAAGTAGTTYSLSLVAHPDVTAEDTSGTTMTVRARVKGTVGNAITVAVAATTALAWASGTLTGGTDALVDVVAALVDETPAAGSNSTLELAGYRAATGDLEIDANGDLMSNTIDFTTLPILPGQAIWIGGAETANKFAIAANYGYARVVSVTANLIELDKKSSTFTLDDGATKDIDIYFGRFIRNVAVDDDDYIERYFQFEAAFPDLGGTGIDKYEYAEGNLANEMSLELPLTDKAVITFGFIGTDTEVPTLTRKTNASTPHVPEATTAFNTSADIARLRITQVDETGLTTDFKSLTLTLNNNVSPEKVLSVLGARYMNTGIFEVGIEAQVLFTDGGVTEAIRENTTVTMDFLIRNDDGGIFFDIPSMTLGGGDKEFPLNETVLLNTTGQAFEDDILGTSLGITIFPYLPPAA